MYNIKRIAVIGPESTGKSELCKNLASYFNTLWIPEHSREYLAELDHKYTLDDVVNIYSTQFDTESSQLKKSNKLIFIDTEFIIAKVWCEHVFGICPGYISEMIHDHPYDLYLLTYPDLPWVYDPLRENPGKGDYFFSVYKNILEQNNLNFSVIKGSGQQRTDSAISSVNEFFSLR